MFVASYRNTMRNVRPVEDTGIDLRRRIVEVPKPIIAVPVSPVKIILDNLLLNRRLDAQRAIAAGRKASERARPATSYDREMATVMSLDTIMRRISRATGVSILDICSARRNRKTSFARQAVFYWACRRTKLSLPQIGRRLGGRDHTTILHGKQAYVGKRAHQGRTLRSL
jgi:chromosomal replication initiation ATPase DnaA